MNYYRYVDKENLQFDFLTHYQDRFFYDDEIESLGGKIIALSVRSDHIFLRYLKDLDLFFAEHAHEYIAVHGHMESLGYWYLKAAHKYGVPVRIAHSHNADTEKTIKGKIKGQLLKLFDCHATHRFACSQAAGEFMFRKRPFQVWNNAIPIKAFQYNETARQRLRRAFGLENEFVIGHIGRFCKQKNQEFLVEIFKEIHERNKNSILFLVGSGETEPSIRQLIKEYDLRDSVKLLGVRQDVTDLYQVFDVFVFPSRFEGLGMVAIEAQVAGLHTFCSDAVPKEAHVTPLFHSLPLSAGPKKWAEEIQVFMNGYPRNNMVKQVEKAGFGIEEQAQALSEFYLANSRETE